MISDDERREVAARLRNSMPKEWLPIISVWNIVQHACGIADMNTNREKLDRLADLIDPTIPADPGETGLASVEGFIGEMRHSTKEEQDAYSAMLEKMSVELHPVDRDALLSLADEIDANGDRLLADSSLLVGVLGLMRCYANIIREALGETRKE